MFEVDPKTRQIFHGAKTVPNVPIRSYKEHAMPAPSLHPAGSPTVVPETTTENCIFQCAQQGTKKKECSNMICVVLCTFPVTKLLRETQRGVIQKKCLKALQTFRELRCLIVPSTELHNEK